MALDNSRFSSLVYRIIGKPDRWHDDYIDIMHQILDETDDFNDPDNFSELEIGDQILSRISHTNEALKAFGTLLDKSRFKMIILDQEFSVIYRNENAEALYNYVRKQLNSNKLNLSVLDKIKLAAAQNQKLFDQGNHGGLCSVDYRDQNNEQLYLRTIQNHSSSGGTLSTFHLLLVVDKSGDSKQLNPDLVERYELTDKEQSVLANLVHGENIKQIALSLFVSENTVKTHLKALFRKTNTKSQSDIIRLVLTHESRILDTYFGSNSNPLTSLCATSARDKFVTLSNGLKVAYREYGPLGGHPIVVCHNGYGCRITIPHGYEDICERQNKRIIIPDRPGFGLTSQIDLNSSSWNTLFFEFIDQLELKRYDLLGTVLGSVVALELAVKADCRLQRVRLSSPIFVNTRKDNQYLIGIFAPVTRLIRASERFAREIYELWLKSVTINLSLHYRNMLTNGLGSAERKSLLSNNTIELMIDGFRQGSLKGVDGIAQEMVSCLLPKKVDLGDITVPVDLWWGTEDNRITLEGVENLASQLSKPTIHIKEGYSEYIYYALFEDIIS